MRKGDLSQIKGPGLFTAIWISHERILASLYKYIYRGTQINSTGRTESDIEIRIVKGKHVIGALDSLLWSKNLF